MKIFCIKCQKKVEARLTDGTDIYPHRDDLRSVPFWKCDTCGNYVGCHYKTKDPTKPLGHIPTMEVRAMRRRIHEVIDPLWRAHRLSRNEVYRTLSLAAGYLFHIGELVSVEEGERILQLINVIYKKELVGRAEANQSFFTGL